MIGFRFTSQLNLKFRVYSDKFLEPLESLYVKVMDKTIERFALECRKVIGFALNTLQIDLKKSRPFFVKSEVKLKPIVMYSLTFSRASRQRHALTSNFDWFIGLPLSYVIGWSDYFGFGFMIHN